MKRSLLCGVVAATLALAVSPVLAADINFSTTTSIGQGEFRSLSREAGAALGYRKLAPAAPLGITGFDIGGEVSFISINRNSSYWSAAFNSDAPSYLVIPTIRARKGLPLGIDIGAMYSYVPNSNIKLYGAELSKSILDGSVATPAVGVRATYTKLAGVNDLDLQTYGFDASISKGFPAVPKLTKENDSIPRIFGGIVISPLPLFGITGEVEYAVRPIYSLKAAVSF